MIIDVHSHDFARTVAVRAMASMCRVTEGRLWPAGDGTLRNHLDAMRLAGVDKAVWCPIATKPQQWEVILRRATDILSGVCGVRAQRQIVPFASVHPNDPQLEEHLERIALAGVKGVKFHPYYQDFALTEPRVERMFRIVADLGLVVQCHAGGDLGWKEVRDCCGPREIEGLMKKVRRLTFIAAHLGGCYGYPPGSVDRLLDCGVYIDTSVLHRRWHHDEEMRLLRSWPTERILFATDFPWTHYPEAIRWVRTIRDPRDHAAVFGGNACRLLDIDEHGGYPRV